jgi:hypothetical protein
LREAALSEAVLHEAVLHGAVLHGANLYGADLSGAVLYKTELYRADLREAELDEADLREADLYEALLAGASMRNARGAYWAHGLETTRLTIPSGKGATDALYFETCDRLWSERWLDWERLRIVGRLPLFGPSYAILILVMLFFSGLELYNDLVAQVRTWARQLIVQPDHHLDRLASLVLAHLQLHLIPLQSFLLVISTFFLAIGSTLFLCCPSRVKEFSRDQWCDELGRPLVHYWPVAWKRRPVRLVCAVCYAVGGFGALLLIVMKVWWVLMFILKYSPYSWPWQ